MAMVLAFACQEDPLMYIKYMFGRSHIVKAVHYIYIYVTRLVKEAALWITIIDETGVGMEVTGYSVSCMMCTKLCTALFVVDMLSKIWWTHI